MRKKDGTIEPISNNFCAAVLFAAPLLLALGIVLMPAYAEYQRSQSKKTATQPSLREPYADSVYLPPQAYLDERAAQDWANAQDGANEGSKRPMPQSPDLELP